MTITHNWPRGFLLLGVLLSGCGTLETQSDNDVERISISEAAVSANAKNDVDSCELMYEVRPHKTAIEAFGVDQIARAQHFSIDETGSLSHQLIPLSEKIALEVVDLSGGNLELVSQEVVQGGYEGRTSASVVMALNIHSANGYQALFDLSARIGYVYAQESTLVICDKAPVEGWSNLRSYELRDSGERRFFNRKNAQLFYGLMLGESQRLTDIGYTYYPKRGVFSTLAESGRENKVLPVLTTWVGSLTEQQMVLEIEEQSVWVHYPHNNWALMPKGESYIELLPSLDVVDLLNEYRLVYLQQLKEFSPQANIK